MLFFAKNKLASLDKKITVYLANSKWYGNNCSRTFADGLDPIDQNEEWVSLVIEFIEVVWNEKGGYFLKNNSLLITNRIISCMR